MAGICEVRHAMNQFNSTKKRQLNDEMRVTGMIFLIVETIFMGPSLGPIFMGPWQLCRKTVAFRVVGYN